LKPATLIIPRTKFVQAVCGVAILSGKTSSGSFWNQASILSRLLLPAHLGLRSTIAQRLLSTIALNNCSSLNDFGALLFAQRFWRIQQLFDFVLVAGS